MNTVVIVLNNKQHKLHEHMDAEVIAATLADWVLENTRDMKPDDLRKMYWDRFIRAKKHTADEQYLLTSLFGTQADQRRSKMWRIRKLTAEYILNALI